MAAHYCVKVSAGDASVELGELAARVARLSGRLPAEIEGMLRAGDVAIADALSYSESLELQRELMRLKIPSKVVSGVEKGSTSAVLLKRPAGGGENEVGAAVEKARRPEALKGVVTSGEAPPVVPPKPRPSGGATQPDDGGGRDDSEGENPWATFFPDLQGAQGKSGEGGGGEASELGPEPVMARSEAEVRAGAGGNAEREARASETRLEGGRARNLEEAKGPDRARLAEAMQFYGERPPFAPRGYDRRPDHVPLLAAVLSALAPGAGQVFNGQPEKGHRYALTFFLLVPWYRAVRDAWSYGEQVRTYYAPRPEPGEARRALGFALRFWLALALVGGLSAFTYSVIDAQRQEARRHAERELVAAMIDVAVVEVEDALAPAAEAAHQAHQELAEQASAFTMSQEERARRLYIIGYQSCVARDYEACEATMRRVTALRAESRDAFRLQAWASIQARRKDPDAPMPEVAPVPTLEEYELSAGPGPNHPDDL